MEHKEDNKAFKINNKLARMVSTDEYSRKCDEKAYEKFKEKPFYLKGSEEE